MGKFLEQIRALLTKYEHGSEAKSFTASQRKEEAYDTKMRGTHTVPLNQIVGSVGRYHDFDRQFRLKQPHSSDKFERIKHLMAGGVPLPPIKLYQIKAEYYVLDGNHRVSAAKELGYRELEATIVEFLPSPHTLDNVLYREKVEFFEKTGLKCSLEITEVGQYQHLLAQVEQHQQFLQSSQAEPVTLECAALDWYQTIYQPLARLIERSQFLEMFPQRTPSDLYAYISSHQWENQVPRSYSKEFDHLIPDDMEEFRKTMLETPENEYPEMKREITLFILMSVSAKREARVIEKLFALPEVQEVHSVHGTVDLIVKAVLTRDLLTSDAETISNFVTTQIRQISGVISTQTLIPGISKIKNHE